MLADTERLHWAAYRAVLLELGVDVELEEYRRHFIAHGGGPEYACRTYSLPLTPDGLRAGKAPRYLELLRKGVRPLPGAVATVERLADSYHLAVATNAARSEVDLILDQLGIRARFDATIAREDYLEPKPAPDAYVAAATVLGLAPVECVVIEDTTRGLTAARAAGMRVVVVPNDLTFDNDFTGCTRRLASLEELTPELLARL